MGDDAVVEGVIDAGAEKGNNDHRFDHLWRTWIRGIGHR